MTQLELLESIPDPEFTILIISSKSKKEVCEKLHISYSGYSTNLITKRMNILNIKLSKRYTYKRIIRKCPVCGKPFETYNGSRGEKKTCSYSCSNTHFRSGTNNGMHQKSPNYRTLCFSNWPKKCLLCEEDRVVEVHHLNENHSDNSKGNLIPLCPTHHQLLHTKKYSQFIKEQINAAL